MILNASVKVSREAVQEGKIAASLFQMRLGEYFSGALRAAAKLDIERAMNARANGQPPPDPSWVDVIGPVERLPHKQWRGYEERQERDAEILRLRQEGQSCRSIAQTLGVTLGIVTNAIRYARIHGTTSNGE